MKTTDRAKALAEYIVSKGYGTIIHYQEIEGVINERRGTSRYYSSIAAAKKELESMGKAVKPIGGGDYQILYPGDYSGAYCREVRLANKRIKHGGKILEGAPTTDMAPEELVSFNKVRDFHVSLQARMAGSVVEVKGLTNKPHPMLQAK